MWQPQTEASLDICVVDTDAQSYLHRHVEVVLSSAERDKQRKYSEAVEARLAFFTPFVVSVDGVLGYEANYLLKKFADKLSQKWKKPYSQVTGWIQATMSFSIVRATNLCLRGSWVKWRSGVEMEDGAGIPSS